MFIFSMVLATQLARLLPLGLSKVKISKNFESWLGHVPIAILTALVVPEFFNLEAQHGQIAVNQMFVFAGIFCFAIGYASKNLLLTTFAGILFVAIYRFAVLG